MELISMFIDKAPEIVTALFAIHAAAVTIVNLTPTPKDDEVVAKYYLSFYTNVRHRDHTK